MIGVDELLRGNDRIPTVAATVARLTALAADERSGAADFERVIRPDPALTAHVLRLANSAFFARSRKVGAVREAVALLGLRRVVEVAATASLAGVLPARLPGYEISSADFWAHCIATGVLAEQLGRELGLPVPELTFTAGLLHDLGKLAIAVRLSGRAGAVRARLDAGPVAYVDAEREVLGFDHAEAGEAIARHWRLPDAVAVAAGRHHRPGEGGAGLVADLIHAGDALAHLCGLGADAGGLARAIDPAVPERLGVRAALLERVAGASLDLIREMAATFTAPAPEARP